MQWVSEKHNYLSIPLYIRENSIIVLGAKEDKPDYDFADGCEVRIYALQDGKEAKSVVYNQKQNVELEIAAKRSGKKISVSINGSKPCTIRFVNLKTSKTTDNELNVEGKN